MSHTVYLRLILNLVFQYDKTFALPSTGKTIFKYWKSWSEADYYKLEKAPDMIVHHMRFSKEVEKVFSGANYFSILRNPVIMFESLFNYMKTVAPQFNKAQTLGKRLIHILKTSRAYLNNSVAPICITDSANGNSKFNRNAIIRVGLNKFISSFGLF